MKKTEARIETVAMKPARLATLAKLAELTAGIDERNRRISEIDQELAANPVKRELSPEAIKALGNSISEERIAAIEAAQVLRSERSLTEAQIAGLKQAQAELNEQLVAQRVDLSHGVCAATASIHRRLLAEVRDAVLVLKSKARAAVEFIDTLEEGETIIAEPIRKIDMPFADELLAYWADKWFGEEIERLDKAIETNTANELQEELQPVG